MSASAPGETERRSVERRLRAFIVDELLEEPYDGEDPLADRAVDSLAVEQLVEYIAEAYEVELADDEMIEENFESLATLAALVQRKRRVSGQAAGGPR